MSASEKLRAISATHERVLPIFRRTGPDDWERDRPAESVMDALPEIIAVIEAAEKLVVVDRGETIYVGHPKNVAALALLALEEELSQS